MEQPIYRKKKKKKKKKDVTTTCYLRRPENAMGPRLPLVGTLDNTGSCDGSMDPRGTKGLYMSVYFPLR